MIGINVIEKNVYFIKSGYNENDQNRKCPPNIHNKVVCYIIC